jgi:hypothetical protein
VVPSHRVVSDGSITPLVSRCNRHGGNKLQGSRKDSQCLANLQILVQNLRLVTLDGYRGLAWAKKCCLESLAF